MFLVIQLFLVCYNNNVTIDGTLDVSSITTLSDLSCNKNVTIDGTLDVGEVHISNNLEVNDVLIRNNLSKRRLNITW